MPKADKAEELEYLPSGKRSRTEAKEEDVEMEATAEQHEEPPQDEPTQRVVDMPDFGDLHINDEYSDSEEVMVRRSNEFLNSTVYEHFAFEEEPEARGAGQFVATPAMARFLHNVLGREKWTRK